MKQIINVIMNNKIAVTAGAVIVGAISLFNNTSVMQNFLAAFIGKVDGEGWTSNSSTNARTTRMVSCAGQAGFLGIAAYGVYKATQFAVSKISR